MRGKECFEMALTVRNDDPIQRDDDIILGHEAMTFESFTWRGWDEVLFV